MNQEVLAYLPAFISYAQLDWPLMIPTAKLAINNRDSSVSSMSPFFLLHGYHAEPVQLKATDSPEPLSVRAKRAENFVDRMREAQEFAAVAMAAMAAAQITMEEQANKKRNPSPRYEVGDKVWLNLRNIQTPQPKKKLAWVNAKYTVIKVVSPQVGVGCAHKDFPGIPYGFIEESEGGSPTFAETRRHTARTGDGTRWAECNTGANH
ncbi:hypothetical protein K3495_g10542 [Podosphaera aphanis]|nr:hypothetical protein K3495_g10542 [Podosphaera aphanis]